ncbi:hypothetical protein J2Y68_003241 [Paenarthrobacter nitroguajacolicus]|nr:hypothetical protein [Paenarthrobacter nitroguajacolicus]
MGGRPSGAGHRGRSAAGCWPGRVVAGGGPPFTQRGRRCSPGACGKPWRGGGDLGESPVDQGKHARRARTPFGRPLRFAPWPAVGPGPDVAELRRARSCCVYDVFWLLSFGFYVSAPPRLAPPQAPGPAVQEMSLRRSCVAYFLREFPTPCPRVDRPPSATAPQASPAAKKQRGERGAGRSPKPPHPPPFSAKEGATCLTT